MSTAALRFSGHLGDRSMKIPFLCSNQSQPWRRRIRQAFTSAATLTALAVSCYVGLIAMEEKNRGSKVRAAQNDLGDLRIVYRPVRSKALKPTRALLKRSRHFETVAQDLNQTLSFPIDLPIEFLECGSADAYYDGRSIGICYELVQRYVERLGDSYSSAEEAALHAGLFTLFHELGHALIDHWELPVTGREEDVVDEFATIMLIWAREGDAALSGAKQFAADAQDWEALPFWDDHGLDMQRYYNVNCFVYGSDPKRWKHLVEQVWLPEERARVCSEDYQRKSSAWSRLLQPYLKKNLTLSLPPSQRFHPLTQSRNSTNHEPVSYRNE